MDKKILFVGSFKNLWDEEGIARSFEKLGCEVRRIPEETFEVSAACKEIDGFKPDIVLYAKLKVSNSQQFIDYAKRKDIVTVSWTFDLYFGIFREILIKSDPIFRSDFVFGPDGGNVNRFREMGINYNLLRQGIYDEYCYLGNGQDANTDVIFVGTKSRQWIYRNELLEFLNKSFKFRWIGATPRHPQIRGHELNGLYRSVKIVIGDSVYSPHYWSNRIYETLGRGGFIIHPKIEGLDEEYAPFKQYVPYHYANWEQLKEKISYFLSHEEERERIALAGFEHTKQNHTLLNRCKEFLTYFS